MLNNFYNVDQEIDISNEKKYLSYGALILIISSFIPCIGSIISLIAFIFFIIGFYSLSKKSGNMGIFYNMLISRVVIPIMLSIIIIVLYFVFGFSFLFFFNSDSNSISLILPIAILFLFGILYLLIILSSGYLAKKYLDKLAEITNEDIFRTAGLISFYGSFIIIGLLIGFIIETIGYFKMNNTIKLNHNY
jgi:uncharacterized membrane protein